MSGEPTIPAILDVDTGLDDALAIALTVRSPVLDLLGVTTVAGNVEVDVGAENSLRVLTCSGPRTCRSTGACPARWCARWRPRPISMGSMASAAFFCRSLRARPS